MERLPPEALPRLGSPPGTAPAGRGRWSPQPWAARAQTAQSAPVSQVEAMFHHQYCAQAPPVPMDDVRALLASEPTPAWAKPSGTRAPRSFPKIGKPTGATGGVPKPMNGRRLQKRPVRQQLRSRERARERVERPRQKQEEGEAKEAERRQDDPEKLRTVEGFTRPPPWLGVFDDHTEGGVQVDMALHVVEKLNSLKSQSDSNVFIWILVESCRDCANHDSSLRHDEAAYRSRFAKLKEMIYDKFPEGVFVDLLSESTERASPDAANITSEEVEQAPDVTLEIPCSPARGPSGPSYRIGSFEVYMCCHAPLKPWGAAPLTKRGAGSNTWGLCISSKLRSRAWPSIDAVLKRMVLSMPQVPVQVTVQTSLGFPLPGVCITVLGIDRQQISQNSTDQSGSVSICVPLFAPMTLRAERPMLMERMDKAVEVMAPETHLTFTAETCIELLQLETEKELIVFCRDPRMDLDDAVRAIPDLMPFLGNLEYSSGEALRAEEGFIRGFGDPLANVDFVSCTGWRSCPLSADKLQQIQQGVHGTGRLVEVGRLGTPIAQISLVTCCCQSPVPNARVSVNGEHFGITDSGPVSCSLRMGDHNLLVEHSLLSTPGLSQPLKIEGSTTCGIPVDFPLDRLRFLCTAAPGTRMPGQGQATSDLWLVGGDLAQWRCSRGAPPMDAEVWLWDGELCGQQTLKVQAGALSRHGWRRQGDGDDPHGDPQTSEPEMQSGFVGEDGDVSCAFTEALAKPAASIGPWQVVLHCAPRARECAVSRLARLANGDAPALWLARLVAPSDEIDGQEPCLHVHSTCCRPGAAGVLVSLNGEAAGEIGENGELKLPNVTGPCVVGIQGVPSCLLPGSTNEYLARFDYSRRVDLELACLVWVYSWHPEVDEDEDGDKEDLGINNDAMVFVCTNVDQIPDEAKPVVGRLCCAEAEEPEIILDGQSVGPVLLRRSRLQGGSCLVSQLFVDVVAPPGYVYEARVPSPLQMRHEELQGCELQRLMHCPAVLGDLRSVRATSAEDEGAPSDACDAQEQAEMTIAEVGETSETEETTNKIQTRPDSPDIPDEDTNGSHQNVLNQENAEKAVPEAVRSEKTDSENEEYEDLFEALSDSEHA